MALTFDSALAAQVAAAANKQAACNAIITALGPTRTLRMFRDPSANASNPFATGVEFQNVAMTGTMTTKGGTISGFGNAGTYAIKLAADVSTGTCCLRIEGNGHFVQGSLSLNAAVTDWALTENPTAGTGIGFNKSSTLGAYAFLPSGTGPVAPTNDLNKPASIELFDWTVPASPVLVGTVTFNTRIKDFIYQDAELAASTGDVAIYQSTNSILYGNHEFGATLLVSNPSNTEVGNIPLYQVLISCIHKGTWTSYPASDTYDSVNHIVFPKPFKIKLKDGNSPQQVLHTFEMHDALPINSPQLSQGRDATHELRPLWNCAMMLPWQNTRPRISDKARKYYSGIVPFGLRPTIAKGHFSVLSCEPLITSGYSGFSLNGLGNIYGATQWPLPRTTYAATVLDPYLNNYEFNVDGHSAFSAPWAEGWDYEPGSYSTHNWYTGPGGPRFDRSVIPSTLALWMTSPTGSRLQNNTPWRDMADGFFLGYFNHSNHFVNNPKTLGTAPNSEYLNTIWQYRGLYYENGQLGVGPKIVQINGNQRDGGGPSHLDVNGNMIYNGWGRDPLHSYCNAGWGALLLNSPMHAIGSKFDTITQFILEGSPNGIDLNYMIRTQAWSWLAHTMAWKLGTTHPLGFSQEEIEIRFGRILERIYDEIYVPTMVTNSQDRYFQQIRNLGLTGGGGLGYYMAHVLQLMKQTGLWNVMHSKGGKYAAALEFQIRNMDLNCFGLILDTKKVQGSYVTYPSTDPVPTSWADFSTKYDPTDGSDFAHTATGVIVPDRDVGDWPQAMYPYIRRDYFPEIACARTNGVADACAKYDAYQLAVENGHAAGTSYDFNYRYPSICPIKAPLSGDLGPA